MVAAHFADFVAVTADRIAVAQHLFKLGRRIAQHLARIQARTIPGYVLGVPIAVIQRHGGRVPEQATVHARPVFGGHEPRPVTLKVFGYLNRHLIGIQRHTGQLPRPLITLQAWCFEQRQVSFGGDVNHRFVVEVLLLAHP
jgi:hypothetical protein